jgi:Xaa-Pro aminopeptidase
MGIKNLAFEENYLTWGLHHQLSEKLGAFSPPIFLIPSNGVLEEMRVVKDDAEIAAMEASAGLISAVLDEVIAGLETGVTEKAIAWQIEGLARDAGAEGLAFASVVASGPNSALPHAMPTERKIRPKEPIILDVGVKLEGYCSDMTRTVFLGDPVSDFKTIYAVVRKAQLAALDTIRPGIESNHPDAVARQVIDEAGFGKYFIHSLGHGVGLATHERPRLGPQNPVKLEKGMVVTVEPGIYIPGKGGVRLEEMVVIEEKGPRILTKNDRFYDF